MSVKGRTTSSGKRHPGCRSAGYRARAIPGGCNTLNALSTSAAASAATIAVLASAPRIAVSAVPIEAPRTEPRITECGLASGIPGR